MINTVSLSHVAQGRRPHGTVRHYREMKRVKYQMLMLNAVALKTTEKARASLIDRFCCKLCAITLRIIHWSCNIIHWFISYRVSFWWWLSCPIMYFCLLQRRDDSGRERGFSKRCTDVNKREKKKIICPSADNSSPFRISIYQNDKFLLSSKSHL